MNNQEQGLQASFDRLLVEIKKNPQQQDVEVRRADLVLMLNYAMAMAKELYAIAMAKELIEFKRAD